MALLIIFLAWCALCVRAALRGQMILWAALCLVPLAAISFVWWFDHAGRTEPLEDPFGIQRLTILAFVSMSFVTASTGVLSMVLSGLPQPKPREDERVAKPKYTLWQKLWWKPLPERE